MLSPIVIFAFNRPDSLGRMIESLRRNDGFDKHDIFVYVDGPRNDNDVPKVEQVIKLSQQITPNVIASKVNNGLGESIIKGVTDVINRYGRAIVLEDDLVLMPGFLQYMESALDLYERDERIFSICGYGLKIRKPKDYRGDVYLCNRSSSWGWATWVDRWNSVDWEVSDWETIHSSKKMQQAFNRGGSDMYDMLKGYMEGKNHSWAIRFCYSQHRQGKYSVHPFMSLVANEGYGLDATNCRQKYSRFKTNPNTTISQLYLPEKLEPNRHINSASARYHSILIRIYSKIRKTLNI